MKLEIWHHPRCSKSRATLGLIEASGVECRIRLYLDDPPSAAELDDALRRLDMEPWDLARRSDPRVAELGLTAPDSGREAWITAMLQYPVLIERPVVFAHDGRAILGRPPENVLRLLGG